jgi:hypothetical protein
MDAWARIVGREVTIAGLAEPLRLRMTVHGLLLVSSYKCTLYDSTDYCSFSTATSSPKSFTDCVIIQRFANIRHPLLQLLQAKTAHVQALSSQAPHFLALVVPGPAERHRRGRDRESSLISTQPSSSSILQRPQHQRPASPTPLPFSTLPPSFAFPWLLFRLPPRLQLLPRPPRQRTQGPALSCTG